MGWHVMALVPHLYILCYASGRDQYSIRHIFAQHFTSQLSYCCRAVVYSCTAYVRLHGVYLIDFVAAPNQPDV